MLTAWSLHQYQKNAKAAFLIFLEMWDGQSIFQLNRKSCVWKKQKCPEQSLSFIKVWSNFEFWKSEFHQSFIKLWFSKVWVWSKFDQTLILKVWFFSNFEFWNSKFRQTLSFQSLSFVKVWFISFDFHQSCNVTIKVDKTMSLYSQTLTKLRLWKLKVWRNLEFQNSKFE